MEWISNWIMQLAGIIVVGAVCEIAMLEGEMKKYVKLIVGLVLMLTVIRPILNISPSSFSVEFPQVGRARAVELQKNLDAEERKQIVTIYKKKLEKKIAEKVFEEWGAEASAHIEIEEKDEKTFGNITKIIVSAKSNDEMTEEVVREKLSREFGTEKNQILVEIR